MSAVTWEAIKGQNPNNPALIEIFEDGRRIATLFSNSRIYRYKKLAEVIAGTPTQMDRISDLESEIKTLEYQAGEAQRCLPQVIEDATAPLKKHIQELDNYIDEIAEHDAAFDPASLTDAIYAAQTYLKKIKS